MGDDEVLKPVQLDPGIGLDGFAYLPGTDRMAIRLR